MASHFHILGCIASFVDQATMHPAWSPACGKLLGTECDTDSDIGFQLTQFPSGRKVRKPQGEKSENWCCNKWFTRICRIATAAHGISAAERGGGKTGLGEALSCSTTFYIYVYQLDASHLHSRCISPTKRQVATQSPLTLVKPISLAAL